jgi:DNA polymerase-3 subunit alpha
METTKGQHRCPIHEVAFEVCACCDKTLEVFRRAETNGVFQVEGSGMRKLLKQMKPDRFDDLIALVALFRPGPLGSGMDQTYVNRKNGLEELTYEHPKLEPITKETYGVWCYQEQLMQLSVALAGFTLPQADELRKATAKKKPEAMQKIKDKFIPGCVKHGVSEELAKSLWDKIVFFAEYSFNKSHSAAYALIAWHTAWLKASYPLEFMAALFTNWAGDTDKLSGYVDEARRMGIPIELPDINESDAPFTIRMTPGKPKSILYGLDALKGVGGEAVHAILSARQRAGRFRSIFHFCEEVDLKKVTSAVMDTLAKAGAFRSTGATREQILESTTYFTRGKSGRGGAKEITENAIEAATRCAKLEKKDKAAGQSTLFAAVATDPDLPEIRAWSLHKTLVTEKEALGLYLSGHPLDDYADVIREYATVTSAKAEAHGGGSVTMGGIIRGVRRHITTSGKEMAFVSYEDFSGTIDVVCFPNAWEEYKEILQAGLVCFITGELDLDRETPSLRLSAVYTVEEAPARLGISGVVIITLYEGLADPAALRDVGEIIKAHPGRQQIYYKWHNKKTKWTGPLQPLGTASLPPNVRKEIRTILGNGGAVDAVRRV